MVEPAKLDLLAAMSVFLTPTETPDPTRVINMVMCLSLFDAPNRTGRLAAIRRASHAATLQELTDFVAASELSCSEVIDLGRDVCVRKETVLADLARVFAEH